MIRAEIGGAQERRGRDCSTASSSTSRRRAGSTSSSAASAPSRTSRPSSRWRSRTARSRRTIETVFVMPGEKFQFISSRLIKEVASGGRRASRVRPRSGREGAEAEVRRSTADEHRWSSTERRAPQPIGPYSQAVVERRPRVLLGPGRPRPEDGPARPGRQSAAETRRVLENLAAVLAAAGSSMASRRPLHRVPEEHVRLRRDERGLRAVLHEGFSVARRPSRSRACPKDALVEIDCIAKLGT